MPSISTTPHLPFPSLRFSGAASPRVGTLLTTRTPHTAAGGALTGTRRSPLTASPRPEQKCRGAALCVAAVVQAPRGLGVSCGPLVVGPRRPQPTRTCSVIYVITCVPGWLYPTSQPSSREGDADGTLTRARRGLWAKVTWPCAWRRRYGDGAAAAAASGGGRRKATARWVAAAAQLSEVSRGCLANSTPPPGGARVSGRGSGLPGRFLCLALHRLSWQPHSLYCLCGRLMPPIIPARPPASTGPAPCAPR